MTKVKVIDSLMGTGKTQYAIQHMNEANPLEKFIYITPYLAEVERILENTDRTFYAPNNSNKDGSKMRSLKEMIVDGKDIVSTHSLFQTADDELIELLTDSGYTLILDEVMDVIEKAPVTNRDITDLIRLGHIEVENNRVIWTCEDYDAQAAYSSVMMLARAGNLFYHRGRFLIWAFPPQVFRLFDDVYILTYLFDAQIQRYYFDLYGFQYEYHAVEYHDGKYELIEYDKTKESRKELYELMNVYEGKLNDIGGATNAFSATFLKRMSAEKEEEVRNNIYNYFRNKLNAKVAEILWTTVKGEHELVRKGLAGKGYGKSFLQCNARATNEYQDRWALAYVFNRYMNPIERSFFEDNGVSVNQDLLAVADLLQWVYRSRIRNGESIKLYLPSSRMRGLLKDWSENKI
ncbi:hypothetical protein CR203_03725 [Salipaludibacillus neizhouensis]|uniref:Helicase/UvrB N-terminal domain-containing protein n=1 Tax=Salipaludibacillus neizhouensis TaxID=885475 RepID=A0A3A9KF20_9BACI|nr:hypothetical protein [Salipaludibacillus neizhouensis]RKL69151.1 hypothetical protein CR203_03725 [Salipaludibacillus neizhouensis]